MSFFAPLGTPGQLYVNNFADEEWGTIPTIIRTDSATFTPSKLSFALQAPDIFFVWIWGIVGEDLGRYAFLFNRQNGWLRNRDGVSTPKLGSCLTVREFAI